MFIIWWKEEEHIWYDNHFGVDWKKKKKHCWRLNAFSQKNNMVGFSWVYIWNLTVESGWDWTGMWTNFNSWRAENEDELAWHTCTQVEEVSFEGCYPSSFLFLICVVALQWYVFLCVHSPVIIWPQLCMDHLKWSRSPADPSDMGLQLLRISDQLEPLNRERWRLWFPLIVWPLCL